MDAAVGLLGFGEAGRAFAGGWRTALGTLPLAAYDLKLDTGTPEMRTAMEQRGVAPSRSATALGGQVGAVFSVVTADQALAAAESVARALRPGTPYFDCNSCAPQTKQAASRLIDGAGGRYVDVAVMAPVHPALHRTPLLVSGPHAAALAPLMARLDLAAEVVGADVGRASAMKLTRSIVVKGFEALLAECLLAGRALGVEETVLDALERSYPGFDFRGRGAYALDRMMVHGIRRGAEMEAAAQMLAGLGLPGGLSAATAEWQRRVGETGLDPGPADHAARADLLLAALRREG